MAETNNRSKHFDLQEPNNLKGKNILGPKKSESGELRRVYARAFQTFFSTTIHRNKYVLHLDPIYNTPHPQHTNTKVPQTIIPGAPFLFCLILFNFN